MATDYETLAVLLDARVADFEKTVQMYQQYPEIIDYLGNLISSVNVVRTTTDIKQAFEKDTQKAFGKTIMVWQE